MSFKNITRAVLVIGFTLVTTTVEASPPLDWIKGPDARAEFVDEAVFGGRVALYQAGPHDAEAVVLVHGLGKPAARDWSQLIPALAQRYRVYAIDLPGFGHSDKGNHLYSPDNFARVLEEVLQKHAPIEKRVQRPFILIGHSMGGPVALAYVAAYPQRVSRLVLVDAAGILHRSVYAEFLGRVAAQRAIGIDSPWFESVVRAIQLRAENWPVRGELALERPAIRQRLLRGDPNAISAFAMVEHDFSQILRAIRVPTLVIWGAEDTVAPLRTGQALASAIPGARLVVLEGAGHAPQVQFPDRFNPIVLDEIDGRQVAAPPYPLQNRAIEGKRAAHCDAQRGQEFSGDYQTVILDNCQDARISNARIGLLQARHSTVHIVNSHLRDGAEASNSRLELTGGSVGGVLSLDATSVDAAATRFESQPIAANSGQVEVILRLSVAEASRPGSAPRPLHDIFRLAPGATLIR
jgi:pimeloyl-ACP methyl ester carboxylesterase